MLTKKIIKVVNETSPTTVLRISKALGVDEEAVRRGVYNLEKYGGLLRLLDGTIIKNDKAKK